MKNIKVVLIFFSIILIFPHPSFAKTTKPKIKKSFISEDASLNMFAIGGNLISLKNKKTIFTTKDKKVTWSAVARRALQDSNKFYKIYWYGPDGKLIDTTVPKNVGFESSNIKSSLSIKSRPHGLYKIEVIYKNYLIEEKYFKIAENTDDFIKENDIKHLESILKRPALIYKTIITDPVCEKSIHPYSKKISRSFVYTKPGKEEQTKNHIFKLNKNKIYYKCYFKNPYDLAHCKVMWFSPKGEAIRGSETKSDSPVKPHLKSELNLHDFEENDKKGLWKVECYNYKNVINKIYFLVDNYTLTDIKNEDIEAFEQDIVRRKKEAIKLAQERVRKEAEIKKLQRKKVKEARTIGHNLTLKDINNIYLEDYKFGMVREIAYIDKFTKKKYKQRLANKLRKIGFNVVNDIKQADGAINCYMRNVELMFFGWGAFGASLEVAFLEGNFVVAKFPAHKFGFLDYTPIDKLEDILIEKIKEDYDFGKTKFKISTEGKVIKSEKPRYIYNIIGDYSRITGKYSISENEEKNNEEFWVNPIKPLNEIQIKGSEEASKAIAILVYHMDTEPFSGKNWYDYKRKKKMPKILKEKGILIRRFQARGNLVDTYGYLFRCDVENMKEIKTNFFMSILDYKSRKFKDFSTEDNIGEVRIRGNHIFWRDLSYLISSRIEDYFIAKGYKTIDLTPARLELVNMRPPEILKKISDLYNIEQVIIVPYSSYTKWVHPIYRGERRSIGFLLSYNAYIYEIEEEEPIFKYVEDLQFLSPMIKRAYGKTNFFSVERDETGKIIVLKDGIIDDEWMVTKVLRKFFGYEKGLTEKVKIGGDLFEKLSEKGY